MILIASFFGVDRKENALKGQKIQFPEFESSQFERTGMLLGPRRSLAQSMQLVSPLHADAKNGLT